MKFYVTRDKVETGNSDWLDLWFLKPIINNNGIYCANDLDGTGSLGGISSSKYPFIQPGDCVEMKLVAVNKETV